MQKRKIEDLTLSKKMAYAIGQLGWATIVNVVNLQLVYFYIPPSDAGIPVFISQAVFLVVLNSVVLLAASGRLLDAITDPFIAGLSDRWNSPNGRRIPFLKAGAIPTALFAFLMFVPIISGQSHWNILWLFVIQALFYISLTVYVTPYFALLPELGHSSDERLQLSTFISITYALGLVLASQVPLLGSLFMDVFTLADKVQGIQVAVAALAVMSIIFMLVPAFAIEEKRYCKGEATDISMKAALKRAFQNKNFIYYVVADFSYFTGLTISTTGLLYYITVLLELEESMMAILFPVLILVSFIFYPAVHYLARKSAKKPLVTMAFLWMGIVFISTFFLGKFPVSNEIQAYGLIIMLAIPISFLGILPNAILADIADHDALKSGVNQEGMYFAARTLMQKFGATAGVVIFAMMTSLGKDVGDDFGIRLSGLAGAALCIISGLYFMKYDEKKLLEEVEYYEGQKQDLEG